MTRETSSDAAQAKPSAIEIAQIDRGYASTRAQGLEGERIAWIPRSHSIIGPQRGYRPTLSQRQVTPLQSERRDRRYQPQ